MARKKHVALTAQDIRKQYPVGTYKNPDTEEEEDRVMVKPEELAEALSDAEMRRKQTLIQRIFSRSRSVAKYQTSLADDEGTSEVGGTGSAGTSGLFSDEFYDQIKIDNTRLARYTDYDNMDAECVELNRAREVTVGNVFSSREGDSESYKLVSKVPRVQAILEGVDERTKMQDEIPGMCDSMLQYGDDFEEVVVDNRMLITRLKWLNPKNMYRNEDAFGRLQAEGAFSLKKSGKEVTTFNFWQVRHLRHNHKRGSKYGRSFYFPARKPFRYLNTMEDGVLMTRINRSDDPLVFSMVAPKGASPRKIDNLMERAKEKLKRRSVMDSGTGTSDSRTKPIPDGNDFYLMQSRNPTDVQPKIERLRGTANLGQLNDVEYFQNKTIMATPVPKSYLGLERDVNCLSLSTLIPCLDGKTRTLGDIIRTYKRTGNLPWVYSRDKDTGKIVPGQVSWAGVTRRDAKVVEVELDDGSVRRCTPEHLWFGIDGSEIEAKDLQRGQQLLPLRRAIRKSKSYYGYEKIYDGRQPCLTHVRVAETLMADELSKCEKPNIHHVNEDKRNNDPRNLQVTEYEDHLAVHNVSRFISLSKYRKEHGAWNKGLRKGDHNPRSASLRKTTYLMKKCLVCETRFVVPLCLKKKVVCSPRCSGIRSGEARDKSIWIRCLTCGERIRVISSIIGRKKFCSKDCMYEHKVWRNREARSCEYCGEEFEVTPASKRRFCSKPCSNTYANKKRAGLVCLPNHQVRRVTVLDEREDTGDITVDRWSNFFISDAGTGGVLVHNSKATLTNQDIEFARQLRNIQREMGAFQRSVYDFQLVLLGITPVHGLYEITYPPISFVDEQMKMTVAALKWDIAVQAKTSLQMPTRWLLENIIGLPEEEIEAVMVMIQAEPPQAAPAVPTIPGGQPFTREHALRDNKMAAELSNIRDMIMTIRAERLNEPYVDLGY